MWVWLLFVWCLWRPEVTAVQDAFYNEEVSRVIKIIPEEVECRVKIRAKNKDDRPHSHYYLALDEELGRNLAFVRAGDTTKAIQRLSVGSGSVEVEFASPVDSGAVVELSLEMVFTNLKSKLISPYPAEIEKFDQQQYFLYRGNAFHYSHYATKLETTTLTLPSGAKIRSYSLGSGDLPSNPHETPGTKLNFGPYEDVQPLSVLPVKVHFSHSQPIIHFLSVKRELFLSHWGGSMNIEEHYRLVNNAAKYVGDFSKLDFIKYDINTLPVLQSLKFQLPSVARDIYYRDDVGNVTTSHLSAGMGGGSSVLELKPRYALMGGWNYTWNHGYNVDLSSYLHYNPQQGCYELETNLLPAVRNTGSVTIDEVVNTIVLPEGASNVRVNEAVGPALNYSIGIASRYFYLDSTGRIAVTLRATNAVMKHRKYSVVKISYDYPSWCYMQKPVVTAVVYFLLFVIAMIVSRTELRVLKKEDRRSKSSFPSKTKKRN